MVGLINFSILYRTLIQHDSTFASNYHFSVLLSKETLKLHHMEPLTNNEFLNSVLEAEAWKEISDNESLSMDILDK